mgnify:CR=1 FL=1
MAYEVLHLKPTLDTSAYAANDILFSAEALKIPARGCKILSVQAVWTDTQAPSEEVLLFFHRENVQILGGAANAAGAATNVLFRPDSGSFLGCVRIVQDSTVEDGLGAPNLLISSGAQGDSSGENYGPFDPVVVSSGTEPSKIYVSALLEVSGGITCAADSLDIFIQVEY